MPFPNDFLFTTVFHLTVPWHNCESELLCWTLVHDHTQKYKCSVPASLWLVSIVSWAQWLSSNLRSWFSFISSTLCKSRSNNSPEFLLVLCQVILVCLLCYIGGTSVSCFTLPWLPPLPLNIAATLNHVLCCSVNHFLFRRSFHYILGRKKEIMLKKN